MRRALKRKNKEGYKRAVGAGVPSLAARPAGWRDLKGNEDTELTTQHDEGQEMRRRYHIRQGRGLRSVPSDGGGDLMGRFRDFGLFWDTHARRLCRPFCFFCFLHPILCRGDWAVGLLLLYYFFLTATCTDLREARSWTGAGRHYDL